MLETALHEKYPAPENCTRVVSVTEYARPSKKNLAWKRDRQEKDGWIVLDTPFTDVSNLDELRDMTQRHGALLIYRNKSEDHYRKEGFSVSRRHPDMYLIRYNPKQVSSTEYTRAMKKYKERMRDAFERDAINNIVALLSPDEWPNDHEYGPYFGGFFRAEYSSSKAHDDPADFEDCAVNAEHCRNLIKLSRKFLPTGWWRKCSVYGHSKKSNAASRYRGGHYGNIPFANALRDLLDNIHGVEERLAEKLEHAKKCEAEYRNERMEALQWFCRWIRREAKLAEVPIPKPPAKPVRDSKKKKAKKKGSRTKCAK